MQRKFEVVMSAFALFCTLEVLLSRTGSSSALLSLVVFSEPAQKIPQLHQFPPVGAFYPSLLAGVVAFCI